MKRYTSTHVGNTQLVDMLQEFGIKFEPDPSATVLIFAAVLPRLAQQFSGCFLSRGNTGGRRLLQDPSQLFGGEDTGWPKPQFILFLVPKLFLAFSVNELIGVVDECPAILEIRLWELETSVLAYCEAHIAKSCFEILSDPAVRVNNAVSDFAQPLKGIPIERFAV